MLDRPELGPSALDRRIELSTLSWYAIGWVAVVLLAGAVRVFGLTAWPLSATEAGIASDSYNLMRGGAISSTGAARPLPTDLTTLAFFLFGVTDTVARLIPLIAGIATVALIRPLLYRYGRGAALCACLLAALSLALVFASQRLDGAALLTLASVTFFLVSRRVGRSPGLVLALLLGSHAALLPLSDPVGWVALPLILAVALALRSDRRLPDALSAAWALLGFAATMLLVTTALLTRPGELTAYFSASFGALWHHELLNLGHLWQLPLFELLVDELPTLIFAIVGLIALRARGQALRVMAPWAVAALVLASLLGEKSPAGYALPALPLVLLGGFGFAWLMERVDWGLFGTFWGAGFEVALLATLAAALSVIGMLLGFSSTSTIDTGLNFVLLVVVILAPLTFLTVRLARGLDAPAWPLIALIGVALMLGIGLRSSALLTSTVESRTGSILTAGSTSPEVGSLVDRLQLVSRDLTDFNQSSLDPAGGHGLTIAVDSSLAQPFRWYFRDYPNFQVVTNAASITPAPQVVITETESAAGQTSRSFALQTPLAPTLTNPNWSRLFASVMNPNKVRSYLGFVIDHRVANPPTPRQFTLSVSSDIAQRLFGETP